jgi:hypothetical protein
MRWVWEIETDQKHAVILEASALTGSEIVWFDGEILSDKISWKLKNEHSIPLGKEFHAKVIVGL